MAATDPVRDYKNRRTQLRQATERVEKLIRPIVDAGRLLQSWRHVIVSGAGAFPAHLMNAPSIPSDGPWPTPQEISDALVAWHQAHHELGNAWERVPEADREDLQSPWESM